MSDFLWISASSPLFFYSPNPHYFAYTSTQGHWSGDRDNTSLVAGNDTYKTTYGPHIGVLLPQITALSFQPIWSDPNQAYNTTFQINENAASTWTAGQTYFRPPRDFEPGTFVLNITCTVISCSDSPFAFRGAWIGTKLTPDGSVMQNVTIDDTSPAISYRGFKLLTVPSSSSSSASPDSASTSIQPTDADYNSTLSVTETAGASANVTFQGASIQVTGVTAPSLGAYTVILDGSPYSTYSAEDNVTAHSVLLFFATNLDTTVQHTLLLTAEAATGSEGVGLVIDSFIASGPQGSTGFPIPGTTTTITGGIPASTSTGTIPIGTGAVPTSPQAVGNAAPGTGAPNAGAIVGAILGSLAGIGLLVFLFRKFGPHLPKKEDKKLNPWDEANLLQNMKNEEVHVTTAANQRYIYRELH
ncbi:hypothetical protein BCR39DRAFT_595631 [Naematelia encephala]|uniref:Mid2 domain-containing protein n=1 Tax=Naematelia encephala TaxID=71784 RepID=A0A1Y2AL40_9TREE|nr:hypothetical protein BCR39DRAFT_595631 [Naematelia encephala]